MGIGIVYASDRDREREKVFGVWCGSLLERWWWWRWNLQILCLVLRKWQMCPLTITRGQVCWKSTNHTNNPLAATITPKNPTLPLPCWKQKVNGNNKDCIIITIQVIGNFDLTIELTPYIMHLFRYFNINN